MDQSAFVISTSLRLRPTINFPTVSSNGESRVTSAHAQKRQSVMSTSMVSRRQVLLTLALTAGASVLNSDSARADRTGKYSTKLTAKRRYLPRIGRGLRAIERASPADNGSQWVQALQPVLDLEDDFVTALKLFGTTYFQEGNRIGPVERELSANVETIEAEFKQLKSSVQAGNKENAQKAYDAISKSTQQYVDTAKIAESLISFAPAN